VRVVVAQDAAAALQGLAIVGLGLGLLHQARPQRVALDVPAHGRKMLVGA